MSALQEEEFCAFENKVDEVMKILNMMSSEDRSQAEEGIERANNYLGTTSTETESGIESVDIDNFLVRTNYDKSVVNKKESPQTEQPPQSQSAKAFMEAVEKDADRRAAERKQREAIAQELRKYASLLSVLLRRTNLMRYF
jgi:hypothetical protein